MKIQNEKMSIFLQFAKFGIVGVSNTIVTAVVIWLLLKMAHATDVVANIIGYGAGVINSFVWNRKWTFAVDSKIKDTFLKFILTFVISYFVQFGIMKLLICTLPIDNYWCHLMAMIPYTIVNFMLNKYYTFKNTEK
jgi:putative flippase GtrA